MKWDDFAEEMSKFSIGEMKDWCSACGNSTGVCADAGASSSSSSSSSTGAGKVGKGGMSKAVAGAIGALVTLAVILGLEALVLLVGGLRVVSKNRLGGAGVSNVRTVEQVGK